jgi:hypothetical protein
MTCLVPVRAWKPFVDDNILFLASLTTSHGEAGLPTSTAQRGGLREVGARGRSLGSGLATFPTKHAHCDRRLYIH